MDRPARPATPWRRSSVTMLTEESGHKLRPAGHALLHLAPLPVAGSADRDQPEQVRDPRARGDLPGNRGWSESIPWRRKTDVGAPTTALPCWSVGTIKRGCPPRTIRGPGRGPGDAVPVFAARFNVVTARVGVGRPASVPGRQVCSAHGCCGFGSPISSGKPEKIRNFSFFLLSRFVEWFFCEPVSGRDGAADAAASPQPSERTGNILRIRIARLGRFSGFGKTKSRNYRTRWRQSRAGNVVVGAAAGWCAPEGKH